MRSASMFTLPFLVALGSACAASPPEVDPAGASAKSDGINNGDPVTAATAELLGMVKLEIDVSDTSFALCSGTLINENWVLTAKHCLSDPYRSLSLTMGTQSSTGRFHILHSTLDVALVRLDTPMRVGQAPVLASSVRIGQKVKCYGYGQDSFKGGASGVLQSGELEIDQVGRDDLRVKSVGAFQMVNHGDSGGTCFDHDTGEAIGVAVTVEDDYQHGHYVPMPVIAAWVRSHTSKEALLPWRHYEWDAAGNGGGVGYWRFEADPSRPVMNMLQNDVPRDWVIVGAGDFDGNGHRDLLWRNSKTKQLGLWLMDGNTIIANGYMTIADDSRPTPGPEWEVFGTGDFDGDGLGDVAFRDPDTNAVRFLFHPASGATWSAAVSIVSPDCYPIGTGDVDGDGLTDLVWSNYTTSNMEVSFMNGATPTRGPLIAYDHTFVGMLGDFDGDGKSDLFWRSAVDGTDLLWLMNGRASSPVKSTRTVERVGDLTWMSMAAFDIDADGRCDLFWRKYDTSKPTSERQPVGYWLMDGRLTDGIGRKAAPVIITDVDLVWGMGFP